MKNVLRIILVLLLSAAFAAAQDENRKETTIGKERQQQETPAQKPDKKARAEDPRGESWPRTIVPTEKINADTVVSFPADI